MREWEADTHVKYDEKADSLAKVLLQAPKARSWPQCRNWRLSSHNAMTGTEL